MNLKIGDFVKVPFYEDDGVEKLWFEVLFLDGDECVGRCDNRPICT